eukprot:TRINITY_DN46498_c0_g1_i1.p1 TRINITY_DN46498_c0_g1~~TRINITY_DN46498_c0_g1_i1.p1  ORF type:complete len:117 (+),score=9.79 TRINITY_DN46498_c0_g1_i1:359-709(+)
MPTLSQRVSTQRVGFPNCKLKHKITNTHIYEYMNFITPDIQAPRMSSSHGAPTKSGILFFEMKTHDFISKNTITHGQLSENRKETPICHKSLQSSKQSPTTNPSQGRGNTKKPHIK